VNIITKCNQQNLKMVNNMTWVKWRRKWREGSNGVFEYDYIVIPDECNPVAYAEDYIRDCLLDGEEFRNDGFRGIEVSVVDLPSEEWLNTQIIQLHRSIENAQKRVNYYESLLWKIENER
jgi:hypothetical protein